MKCRRAPLHIEDRPTSPEPPRKENLFCVYDLEEFCLAPLASVDASCISSGKKGYTPIPEDNSCPGYILRAEAKDAVGNRAPELYSVVDVQPFFNARLSPNPEGAGLAPYCVCSLAAPNNPQVTFCLMPDPLRPRNCLNPFSIAPYRGDPASCPNIATTINFPYAGGFLGVNLTGLAVTHPDATDWIVPTGGPQGTIPQIELSCRIAYGL